MSQKLVFEGKFSKAIYSRIHKGLNSILLILGARGIGKSYLAMIIAFRLSAMSKREFTVDDVVFSMREFLERLKYYEDRKTKWAWIIFDEVGLEVPAREFMKLINKIMSYVAQSFRKTAINLIVVVPHYTMVDLHIQLLSDFWIIMKKRGHGRIYKNRMNPFKGRAQTPLLCELEVGKLGEDLEDLLEAYENKRAEHLSGKYEEYLIEVEKKEESQKPRDLLAEARIAYEQIIAEGIPKRKIGYELMARLQVSQGVAYSLKHQVESERTRENDENTSEVVDGSA